MKISLATITPSHYRKCIYSLLDSEMSCSFVFGKGNTTVKRMDTSIFHDCVDLDNRYIGSSHWYYQKGLLRNLKDSDVIIDDLGIFCLSSWQLLLSAKFKKQKVYHWDHGWYGREGFLKKWIKRVYFGLADGAFIYGNYARNLMIKNGFDGSKLHVIHNSLDYDKQLVLRNKMKPTGLYKEHFANDYPVLCFIGRLTAVKKLDQILKALDILNKLGKFFNLTLIGDGSEKENLMEEVKKMHLDNQVWFYGACYDEKLNASLIYNADLCVAPGNIGLAAMHSMMYGCPCLSHNDFPWQMPEFEAILEGKTGRFFRRDDVADLARAIDEWFSCQATNRQAVREACFQEIDENWNPHKQLQIIKKVIYE